MTRTTLARCAAVNGAILLACALLLSACGGGGAGSSSAAQGGAQPGQHAALGPEALPASGKVSGPQAAAASGSGPAQEAAKLAQLSQSIIYTASMTIRSANAMNTAQQAVAIVMAAGGYTAGEHATSGAPGKSGGTVTLTLKVPVPEYPAVLAKLSAPALGKQLALTQQATDVTQEVATVNSLVTSQEAAITALEGLLKRAATVSELLQVQQQISDDQSYLESLQAQQRALEHETSYATIGMTLLSTQHQVRHQHHKAQHGFLAGLAAGWRALRHATTAVLTAIGAALPFLILLAILAAAGLLTWRRISRNRARSPEAG